jgi:hypothetical protein
MLGCTETLEFFSEVNPSYTLEQRIALRSAPRQSFSYTSRLESNNKLSVARALAKQNSGGSLYIPVWPEETQYIGTLSSATSIIAMDTRYADYRVGGFVYVMQNWENYVIAEIASISVDYLTLTGVLNQTLVNPSIIPLRTAYTPGGYDFDRQATYADAGGTFIAHDNIDLAEDYVSSYPTYNSIDVITERPVLLEPVDEKIVRVAEYVDNGFGPVVLEPAKNYSDFGQTVTFYEPKGERLWKRRLWVHALRGKQKSFYLPTFNNDLILQSTISNVATTISVKSIAETGYYLNKSIMFWLNDGNRYFRGITNAANVGDNDTLTISSALGVTVAVADVKMISFITLNRLNSDEIQFNHRLRTGATVSIPTLEVPE